MNITGIIFDLKRFAVHDGPGIRTTVFFKGCPLNCWWCHNPESRKLKPERIAAGSHRHCANLAIPDDPAMVGKTVSADEIIAEIEKDLAFYDESGGGVTFSGGEPLLQPDFLTDLLRRCREREIHSAVDTSGHAPWAHFEQIYPYTDLFLFDLKLIDDGLHRRYTNVGNRLIHDNLRRLHELGAAIFIRIPLIPGISDTEENLAGIRTFLDGLPNILQVNLLPYNPIGESKYQRFHKKNRLGRLSTQPPSRLEAIRDHFSTLPCAVKIGG